MPRDTQHERIERIRRVAYAPLAFCIKRPLHIVERVDDKPEVVEVRPHIDVVFDAERGTRSVLQRLTTNKQIDRWHEIADDADTYVIEKPLTCTRAQLPAVLDRYSKHIYLFGGNQSGKSHIGCEILFDWMLLSAGKYLYLAPEQEKTQVGVEKLCRDTDFARAIIPRELILSYPETARTGDQAIRLIDGRTVAELRYCSRKGGNLKGLTGIRGGVLDEGTEVQHEINFTIATNRLLMARGQMVIPTTPVAGHWLQAKDQETRTYDEIETLVEMGDPRPRSAKAVLSCFDNPWLSEEEVQITIDSLGGIEDPRVKREVLGQWVSEGERLWRQYSAARHLAEFARRDVETYGYVNLTPIVARELFKGFSQAREITHIYGQDFNFNPYSVAEGMIIAPRDSDHRDPDNWILYINDEVIRRSRSTAEFAEWFTKQAGQWFGRGLDKDYFGGAHIVADGTGFYQGRDRRQNVSADAAEMRDAGCVVRAPMYSKGKGHNPPRRVRIGFLNELMFRNRLLVNRQRCPMTVKALENEVGDGTGDTLKGKNTAADRMSGITDGIGYLAYAALFRRKAASQKPAPAVVGDWG